MHVSVVYQVSTLSTLTELVCYSDSLHCINLLKGPAVRFHVYAVIMIQDVKYLIE